MNIKKIKSTGMLALIAVVTLGMISTDLLRPQAERPIGFVRKFKPQVSVVKDQKKQDVSKAEKLYSGDTLSTNDHGFALVQFIDKSIAKIKPNSELVVRGQVNGKQNSSTRIDVDKGELFLQVTKRSTTHFEVATNTSVAAVKGTQFGARGNSYFWVIEGVVAVTSKKTGQTERITKHRYAQVDPDGTIKTGELTDEQVEKLQEDYNNFDQILEPKVLKLRYRDKNGQVKTLELKYFDNDEQ